jgi:plastocyanin
MRRLVLSFAVALALGGGVAMAQYPDPPTPAPATSAPKAPAPEPSPVSTIHIKNFAYVPASVTIPAGSTVRFIEDDETPHTVTATDHSYDSGNLNQKDTWKHTFATAGTYNYFCAYHTYMKGTVIVK